MAEEEKREMTVRDAGKMGGDIVKAKYGVAHYSRIGKKGGASLAQQRGTDFFTEIGHLGGEAKKAAHGVEHYSEIGTKGGAAVRAKYGSDYYSRIGRLGGRAKRKANKDQPE